MAMNVNVGVIGSSMVYFKNGVWNIVFITDTCHLAKFANPDTGGGLQPLAKSGYPRTIEFKANNTPAATGWDPAEAAKFVNMSDARMHGQLNATESNLRISPTSRYGRQWVHMKIPYGTVTAVGPMSDEYYYKRYGAYNRRWLMDEAATMFSLSFRVPANNPLDLVITDPLNPTPIHFNYRNGNLDLIFNSYCPIVKSYNDYVHHYDWVFDRNSPSESEPIWFLCGEVTDPRYLGKEVSDGEAEEIESADRRFHEEWANETLGITKLKMGPAGDCDPVIIDPPPGD